MAQNRDASATKHRRGPGRRFAPGVSGNPGGRPRAALDVQALARQYTAQAIATLVDALSDERLCVSAAVHLLDRGWGRPKEHVHLDGDAISLLRVEFVHTDQAQPSQHTNGKGNGQIINVPFDVP